MRHSTCNSSRSRSGRRVLLAAAAASVTALGAARAQADVLEGFNFFGLSPSATVPANNVSSGLDVADPISRGAGAPASAGNNSFRTLGFKNDGIATTNTDYFQIDASAAAGDTLSLTNLVANFAGTSSFYAGNGVSTEFAYSLDGTIFTLAPSTLTTVTTSNLNNVSYDLSSVAALQNLSADTTVTLRFYASGQTATGGFGFYSGASTTQGLQLNGSVASTSPLTYDPTATGGGTASTAFANAGPANFLNTAGADVAYANGNAATFTDLGVNASGGSATVTVAAAGVSPGSLAVTNTTGTYTFAGPGGINGPTALVKSGAGTLVLASSNAYSGGTTISGGTVSVSADANLGTGNVILAGGTLQATAGFTSAKALTFTANTTSTVDTGPNAIAFTGVASSSGMLTKTGTGGLTLGVSNSSIGAMNISAGSVTLDSALAKSYVTFGASRTTFIYGTLNVGTSAAHTVSLEPAGSASFGGTGAVQLAPGSSIVQYDLGASQFDAAVGLTSANGVTPFIGAGTGVGTAASGANHDIFLVGGLVDGPGGPSGLNFGGPTTGGLAYTGTILLSGSNTYSGGTTITAGTVEFISSPVALGTGPVVITSFNSSTGGTLLAFGSSPNPITIAAGGRLVIEGTTQTTSYATGAETWNASGGYLAHVDAARKTADLLQVSGLTINAASAAAPFIVTLQNVSNGSTVLTPGAQLLLATDTNPADVNVFANALAAGALVLNANGLTSGDGGALTLREVDTDGGEGLVLVVSTPEPTSLLLLATAAAPLAIGRRRRRTAAVA